MNEQYAMPAMPEGSRDGILKGLYRFRASSKPKAKLRAQLFGSGAILPEVVKAQEVLESQYDVGADVWSVTSYSELYRDGHACERWNLLHPARARRRCRTSPQCLKDAPGVLVAASDYVKALPDSIDRWLPRPITTLGTDGFGRSENARRAARVLRGRSPLRRRRDAGGARARRQDRAGGRREGAEDVQHQSGEAEPGDFVTISPAGVSCH